MRGAGILLLKGSFDSCVTDVLMKDILLDIDHRHTPKLHP
jgi:hypothetical protein